MTTGAPEIQDTLSPYWLRLYGKWVHLNGVRPENSVDPGRAFSELITVDGYRYVQRAPRGPRTWTLDYEYATAAATAALESAAYDNNYDDPNTRTLFLDTNQARVNMADPDLNTAWSTSWSNNTSSVDPNYAVINVGESPEDPIWQPTYDVGPVDGGGINQGRRAWFPVREGVVYTAAVWTVLPVGGFKIMKVLIDGVEVASYTTVGGSTAEDPELASITFTAVEGVAEVVIGGPPEATGLSYYTAGFMFYEGDCPPDYYRSGRRQPCAVAVQDAPLTTNLIWPAPQCDPCKLPRETSTFTILEVGTDTKDMSIDPGGEANFIVLQEGELIPIGTPSGTTIFRTAPTPSDVKVTHVSNNKGETITNFVLPDNLAVGDVVLAIASTRGAGRSYIWNGPGWEEIIDFNQSRTTSAAIYRIVDTPALNAIATPTITPSGNFDEMVLAMVRIQADTAPWAALASGNGRSGNTLASATTTAIGINSIAASPHVAFDTEYAFAAAFSENLPKGPPPVLTDPAGFLEIFNAATGGFVLALSKRSTATLPVPAITFSVAHVEAVTENTTYGGAHFITPTPAGA